MYKTKRNTYLNTNFCVKKATFLTFKTVKTDGIFETGAYGVTSKPQNPTVLDQDGPFST